MSRIQCFLLAIVLIGGMHAKDAAAQTPRQGEQRAAARIPSALDLLELEEVRAELQVQADQLEKLRSIRDEGQQKLRGMVAAVDDLPGEQRRERLPKLREQIGQLRQQVNQQVAAQLSPQQRERMQQLQLQALLRRLGLFQTLTQDTIATRLQMGEEQQTRLRAIQQTFRREAAQQIRELQVKAQQQMLGVLSPEQQAEWQQIIGEPFEFVVREHASSDDDP